MTVRSFPTRLPSIVWQYTCSSAHLSHPNSPLPHVIFEHHSRLFKNRPPLAIYLPPLPLSYRGSRRDTRPTTTTNSFTGIRLFDIAHFSFTSFASRTKMCLTGSPTSLETNSPIPNNSSTITPTPPHVHGEEPTQTPTPTCKSTPEQPYHDNSNTQGGIDTLAGNMDTSDDTGQYEQGRLHRHEHN